MTTGNLTLPKLDGVEIAPHIWLIGEPTPIPGTNKLRCLADVGGALCVVELIMKFGGSGSREQKGGTRHRATMDDF